MQSQAWEWLRKAERLIEVKKYDHAERAVREALAVAPDLAQGWRTLARIKLCEKRYAEARECIVESQRYEADSAEGYYLFGLAALWDYDFVPQIEHAERYSVKERRQRFIESAARRGLRRDPTFAGLYALLAEALLLGGRSSEAMAAVEQGLRISPSDDQCRRLQVRLLKDANKPDHASAVATSGLRDNPESALWHAQLSRLRLESADFSGALEHARNAVKLAPTAPSIERCLWNAEKGAAPSLRPFLRLELAYMNLATQLSRLPKLGIAAIVASVLASLYFATSWLSAFGKGYVAILWGAVLVAVVSGPISNTLGDLGLWFHLTRRNRLTTDQHWRLLRMTVWLCGLTIILSLSLATLYGYFWYSFVIAQTWSILYFSYVAFVAARLYGLLRVKGLLISMVGLGLVVACLWFASVGSYQICQRIMNMESAGIGVSYVFYLMGIIHRNE